MKEYYQAFVWLEGSAASEPDMSLLDRNRSNLRQALVKPYKRGQKLYWESHIKDLSKVVKVEIFKTPKSIFEHIKDDATQSERWADDFNASSDSIFVVNLPSDDPLRSAQGNGEVVTSQFIDGPPGTGFSFAEFLNNQWVIGIGIFLLGLAATAFFGLPG